MIPVGSVNGPRPYLAVGGQDHHGRYFWMVDEYCYLDVATWLKVDLLQSPPLIFQPRGGPRYEELLRAAVESRITLGGQHSTFYQFSGVHPSDYQAVRQVVLINCGEPEIAVDRQTGRFTLPATVDADTLVAEAKYGVLTITAGLRAEAKLREIKVT